VTWTNLLANKEAQRHKTSKKELDNMRALIARDLADAGIVGLSADRRFATAYNAALQVANMAIACAGYRIMSKDGDGSEGDPCPSLSVLRRSRRLDHEKPPFTENVGVRTRPEL
jgi:N-acyl-D-aspartate/D-glutamate deacylase